jgi:hypothetical protein
MDAEPAGLTDNWALLALHLWVYALDTFSALSCRGSALDADDKPLHIVEATYAIVSCANKSTPHQPALGVRRWLATHNTAETLLGAALVDAVANAAGPVSRSAALVCRWRCAAHTSFTRTHRTQLRLDDHALHVRM